MNNIVNGILGRDLARLAREGGAETKLIGRPTTDPTLLNEAEFFFKHGMSRAQAAEMMRERRREEFEGRVVADLNGDPPEGLCRTKGLRPKHALFARFHAWRLR